MFPPVITSKCCLLYSNQTASLFRKTWSRLRGWGREANSWWWKNIMQWTLLDQNVWSCSECVSSTRSYCGKGESCWPSHMTYMTDLKGSVCLSVWHILCHCTSDTLTWASLQSSTSASSNYQTIIIISPPLHQPHLIIKSPLSLWLHLITTSPSPISLYHYYSTKPHRCHLAITPSFSSESSVVFFSLGHSGQQMVQLWCWHAGQSVHGWTADPSGSTSSAQGDRKLPAGFERAQAKQPQRIPSVIWVHDDSGNQGKLEDILSSIYNVLRKWVNCKHYLSSVN